MDISAIAALAGSTKAAIDIVKAIAATRDEALVNDKVIELQRALLDIQHHALSAQATMAAMAEEVRALKEEAARQDVWAGEAAKYVLQQIVPGVVAYVPKYTAEALHQLCPTCFVRKQKSFLQQQPGGRGQRIWACSICKSSWFPSRP